MVDPAKPVLTNGLEVSAALPDVIPPGAIVLVGIKPQHFNGIAVDLDARLEGVGATVLSIMAGLPLDLIRRNLPHADALVRLMPNLPCGRGRGSF